MFHEKLLTSNLLVICPISLQKAALMSSALVSLMLILVRPLSCNVSFTDISVKFLSGKASRVSFPDKSGVGVTGDERSVVVVAGFSVEVEDVETSSGALVVDDVEGVSESKAITFGFTPEQSTSYKMTRFGQTLL